MVATRVKDVAEKARVSPGTVSNFFNHRGKVAPETAARIEQAIEELGYVANPAARTLRTGESRTVAHLTYEVGNPFFADFSQGVQDRAANQGYEVLIADTAGNLEREARFLDLFRAQKVRGLLLSPLGDVRRDLKQYREAGIPVVLLDRHPTGYESANVSVDDVAGGQIAIQHLVEGGRRNLAFVGGPVTIDAVADRLLGAQSAAAATARIHVIETSDRRIRDGRAAAQRLLERGAPRFDGVFAANDLIAVGLLHGLLAAGVRVPEDVAIVGYDDIDFAADAIVPLTSVKRPSGLFGRTALDLLHSCIETGEVGNKVIFQPELIRRASTS